MPIRPTYPGVYVQEIPSGVHTITGVATSITAFIGQAKSGPVNVATDILSFADFERQFGGLDSDLVMSYAVYQFFLNGGTQAVVVRVVSPSTSTDTIKIQGGNAAKDVLQISARSPGQSDRTTDVFIEHDTDHNPTGFKLIIVSTAKLKPTDAPHPPKDIIVESFPRSSPGSQSQWLSMDKTKSNYVVTQVNGASKLITVTDLAQDGTLPNATSPDHGGLSSGSIKEEEIKKLPHPAAAASGNTPAQSPSTAFRITLDGTTPYTVKPTPPSGSTFGSLDDAATAITTAVHALKKKDPAFDNFTCSPVKDAQGKETGQLTLVSGSYGSNSSVTVQPLAGDTLAADLQLVNGTAVPATTNALTGGSTGTPPHADEEFDMFIGSRANFEGIYALDKVDLVNLICLPGVSDPNILSFVDAYCQERRAFMIVDPPPNLTPNDMYNDITGTFYGSLLTNHGALYYPRPLLPDPLNKGNHRAFPPCGVIAGLYARTDSNRGVWKSPAGTEATLTGVQAFEYTLNNGENGILNPQGVNCLRFFPGGYGFVSWGARTLRGSDNVGDEYQYVAVRRTALFLEESLLRGLQWAVFEPNADPLWAQIRLNAGAFMQDLFRKGAFKGQTPRDAFFVKCDSETTTTEDIDRGIVNVVVGFAPLKPAEFVIISLQQIAGQPQA